MRHIFLALIMLGLSTTHVFAGILDIKEVKSKSGITAWLVEDHTIPVIAMKFSFKESGTSNDPIEKQGLTRLLSNTLDEGAGDLDSKAFQEIMSDLSISISFSASRDQFSGNLKTLTVNKKKAFELLSLALTKPRFDQEAIDRMRLANLTRIKSDMTDPDWMAARLMNDVLFKGHPYAMNSGGTLTSLTKITAEDLRKKVSSELTRDRLIVSVAGDISAEDLSSVLDEIFGGLPATGVKNTTPDATLPQKSSTILYKKDIPQTIIQMVMPGVALKDPDYFATEIMNFVFGGAGFGSRLMEVIREQRGLTYGVYSSLSGMDHANTLGISSSSKNATAKELIDLSLSEMQNMTTSDITPQELRNAKNYLIGSVPLDLTSTDRIAGYMLAFQSEDLPMNYLDIREAGLNAVTIEDVKRVAQKTLQPDKTTIILVGNPANITPTETVSTLPNVE